MSCIMSWEKVLKYNAKHIKIICHFLEQSGFLLIFKVSEHDRERKDRLQSRRYKQ